MGRVIINLRPAKHLLGHLVLLRGFHAAATLQLPPCYQLPLPTTSCQPPTTDYKLHTFSTNYSNAQLPHPEHMSRCFASARNRPAFHTKDRPPVIFRYILRSTTVLVVVVVELVVPAAAAAESTGTTLSLAVEAAAPANKLLAMPPQHYNYYSNCWAL